MQRPAQHAVSRRGRSEIMEGTRMKARSLLVVTLVAATGLQGCTFANRFVEKPWGKGTWIPAAVCAAAGAGAGYAVQDALLGTSTVTVYDSSGNVIGHSSEKDNAQYWMGALAGAAIMSVVCGLAGHYFLDPEEEAPPPPPTPTPTPSPESLPAPSSKRLVLRGVNFDFNKSDIRPDSRPVLDEAAEVLAAHPGVRIAVEGYTDSKGTDAYNEKLSVRRAEAVFRYLVNRGVAPERMEVIGYGETRPVADNDTEQGRAENRRVELHIVKGSEGDDAGDTAPAAAQPAPAAVEPAAAEPTPTEVPAKE